MSFAGSRDEIAGFLRLFRCGHRARRAVPHTNGAIYSRADRAAATEIARKHCIFIGFLPIMRRPNEA
jgi:hypothetical protein